MQSLRLDDSIENIFTTLHKEYHLTRLLKSSRNERCSRASVMSAAQELGNEQGLFRYLVLDRQKANLAPARHHLGQIEKRSDPAEPGLQFGLSGDTVASRIMGGNLIRVRQRSRYRVAASKCRIMARERISQAGRTRTDGRSGPPAC
jgi:hypothetical protein